MCHVLFVKMLILTANYERLSPGAKAHRALRSGPTELEDRDERWDRTLYPRRHHAHLWDLPGSRKSCIHPLASDLCGVYLLSHLGTQVGEFSNSGSLRINVLRNVLSTTYVRLQRQVAPDKMERLRSPVSQLLSTVSGSVPRRSKFE